MFRFLPPLLRRNIAGLERLQVMQRRRTKPLNKSALCLSRFWCSEVHSVHSCPLVRHFDLNRGIVMLHSSLIVLFSLQCTFQATRQRVVCHTSSGTNDAVRTMTWRSLSFKSLQKSTFLSAWSLSRDDCRFETCTWCAAPRPWFTLSNESNEVWNESNRIKAANVKKYLRIR